MLVDRSLVEVDVRLYPTSLYTSYVGNTVRAEVAFFATSIAMSRDYIIVGAPGYGERYSNIISCMFL